MFSRILKLSGRYKGRIQGAFVCAFLESILSKMPIVLAFVVLSRFAADTLTSQTCLYIGLGLAAAVLVQMLVHYLSDSLQSAAGYLMFADKRMELGSHLRKLPMGYFTSGNIGKISSVLSTDMVFIEEVMDAALDRIEAVLNEPELPDTGKQHLPAQAQPGQPEVQFNDVVFAYQDKEVLHHISFAMKKDSMTALVGPSGSGKSTIANLLARLWDVKSGSIIIRGMDIRNVPLAELIEQISMVFQRVYLFQDTIYNNISIGKPDATEEEVYTAAKKARCYDFIMALPDGFQTVVGEGGATLSGGEKQRISIARCILKDAPIIILDEATASVDTDNESYIQEAISELVKGKTLLVIAHRLNTIQNADQILVIDNGQIAQQGTHEELLKQPGIYQEFVNIRKNAAGWSLA